MNLLVPYRNNKLCMISTLSNTKWYIISTLQMYEIIHCLYFIAILNGTLLLRYRCSIKCIYRNIIPLSIGYCMYVSFPVQHKLFYEKSILLPSWQ